MKHTQLNFAVDAAAFAAFLFVLSTGLLLRYQLPAGSGGLIAARTGRGDSDRPVTLLWGWTRHDWGHIHYWIASMLIAILAVHLVLHWKWIVCVVRGTQRDASGFRFGLGFASLIALVLIAAAPLFAPLERATRGELQRQQSAQEFVAPGASIELRGSMTLAEAADATNHSVSEILDEMGIGDDVGPNEQIGRLLREHGLQMSDLRRMLETEEHIATKETEP